ncbi:MAG: FAD-binding oxidoreductase [Anaerolineales bacterium]|jgi:sarcosine oxidase subunit beta|nr:FAD-binding oxidoreductase [Anaerolineales bacterium]
MTHQPYDTIIIGAGSVGTPLAWQLAEAGQKVLVLDQFASAGQGSNKEAIGGIRATHSDPAKIQIGLKSLEIFSNWKETHGDDLGWEQGGYSFVAYHAREEQILKELLVTQKRFGLDVDWYDASALLEIIPSLNPDGLIGGTFSPGDGSASPMLSVLAFERRAKSLGADFHYNETVTAIECDNGRVSGVKTDQGAYQTALVVNAAGPWAKQVAALAGVELPVEPDSHEGGITEPVAQFLGPMVVDIHPTEDSANYYFYQHHTGQIIFCITPNPPIVGMDRRETSVFLPQVAKRMIGIMPRLKNIKVRRTWRGLYPMTPDGAPIVGEVEGLPGYLNAVGMCGQGYMLGPGLAVYLRQWITGQGVEEARRVLAPLSLYRDFGKKETLK